MNRELSKLKKKTLSSPYYDKLLFEIVKTFTFDILESEINNESSVNLLSFSCRNFISQFITSEEFVSF